MINFRFHLVSLIAVFLALGLGILVGSTVVDQVIVDRLDREIRSVSHESNQLNEARINPLEVGTRMHDFIRELYPICRSITGDGVRETLGRIRQHVL